MSHTISWTIARGELRTEFGCAAPHGAACRLECPAGCLTVDDCPTVGGYRASHQPVDAGRCLVVDWLEEGGTPDELYDGPTAPVRSGPILVDCYGDGWLWRYDDDAGDTDLDEWVSRVRSCPRCHPLAAEGS
jgi:hypothetical protein